MLRVKFDSRVVNVYKMTVKRSLFQCPMLSKFTSRRKRERAGPVCYTHTPLAIIVNTCIKIDALFPN